MILFWLFACRRAAALFSFVGTELLLVPLAAAVVGGGEPFPRPRPFMNFDATAVFPKLAGAERLWLGITFGVAAEGFRSAGGVGHRPRERFRALGMAQRPDEDGLARPLDSAPSGSNDSRLWSPERASTHKLLDMSA